MSIKCFCDDCGKELKFEGFAESVESTGWDNAVHYHDIGIVHEDRNNEDITDMYQHTCKECDLKENGQGSYYFKEVSNG